MRTSRMRAFTLIEVIGALAIASVLLVTLTAVLRVTVTGTQQMRAVMHRARLESGLERIVRRDMDQCFRAGEPGLTFFGQTPTGEGELLEFTTLNHLNQRAAPSPTAMMRVEYTLAASPRVANAFELRRREMPYVPGRPIDRTSIDPERLADGVKDVVVEFYDGGRWLPRWSRDTLPALVRVTIRFVEGPADAQTVSGMEFYVAPRVSSATTALP